MISFSVLHSAEQAKDYHADHLVSGDYYDADKSAVAGWFGQGAEALGLRGQVGKEDYHALIDNRKPDGSKLTARDDAARRPGFDFTISPPKSVSIAALVGGDERVRTAHRAAVAAAMTELESYAAVRARGTGETAEDLARGHKITGNLIGTFYEHETSRAAGNGITPDPQLHTHLVILNATKDADGNFKALETFEMLRARSLVNSVYEHRLCQELAKAGYQFRETGPKTWEIAGISDKEIELFSKRHEAIQKAVAEIAEAEGVTDRKALAASVAQDKRIKKQPESTAETLRADWLAQRASLGEEAAPAVALEAEFIDLSAAEVVEFAKEKLFERSAVVKDVDLEAEIFRRARGSSASIEEIKAALRDDLDILRSEDGRTVTTAAVLENEARVVGMVRDGKERFDPLSSGGLVGERAEKLTDRQREAAQILVTSTDFATVFRGGAGTGKSFTLAAVKESVESGGGCVCVVAPQNKQVFGLKNDGFFQAQTLTSFLNMKDGPPSGSVILVDEAGQIAGADMRRFLSAARRSDCRVILSGDTRQHGAVGASDALIAIEKYAGARIAELPADEETIQRQKVAWHKKAVSLADKGRTGESFDILEKNGVVKESQDALAAAAAASIEAGQDGKSVLVVSQTNRAVETINGQIREQLKAEGKITGEREMMGLRGVDAGKAEMREAGTYAGGAVIIAHSKGDQFAAGEMMKFVRPVRGGIVATTEDGKEIRITARNLEKCMLVREEKISVGVGDKIQIRANVRLSENKDDKLANGQIVSVSAIGDDGALTINDGKRDIELPGGFRQFSHGYAVTSYGSQGATVDKVIVADSGSAGASHKKEFYVSISRGKEAIEIHTQDKESLRERIGATGERALALDIVQPPAAKTFSGKAGREATRGLSDKATTPQGQQPASPAGNKSAEEKENNSMTREDDQQKSERMRAARMKAARMSAREESRLLPHEIEAQRHHASAKRESFKVMISRVMAMEKAKLQEESKKPELKATERIARQAILHVRERREAREMEAAKELAHEEGYQKEQMEHRSRMDAMRQKARLAATARAGDLKQLRENDNGHLSPEHAAELKMSMRHAKGLDLDKGVLDFRKLDELRAKQESAEKLSKIKKAQEHRISPAAELYMNRQAGERFNELMRLGQKYKLSPDQQAELEMVRRHHLRWRDFDKGLDYFKKAAELRAKRESAAKIGRLKKSLGIKPRRPATPGLAPSQKKTTAQARKSQQRSSPAQQQQTQNKKNERTL